MKRLLYSTLFICTCLGAYGQTNLDSSIYLTIESEILKKEKRLIRMVRSGLIDHPVLADYEIEQFRIEEYLNKRLEKDPSDERYVKESILAEKRYQVLLSKYTNMLSEVLNAEDREIFDNTQRAWLMYKRKEHDLNKQINPEAYGYEAIPISYIVERHLNITRYRVRELVNYIARMDDE